MLDDLFVPDPTAGDSSNRIPNTRWVTVALASAVASVGLPSIGGLNLLANSSTGTAVPTGLSASNYLDSALGSSQGALLYRNAATWVVLAAGTNGQILQTQGAAANPQWVGGKVLLNTLLPNNIASVADTTSLNSTYQSYEITFDNVTPTGTSSGFQIEVATSGSNFIGNNYVSIVADVSSGLLATTFNITAISITRFSISTGGFYGVSGFARMSNPAGTTSRKMLSGVTSYLSNTSTGTAGIVAGQFAAYWDGGNNAITGLNFKSLGGNIATGTIKIFGVL